MLRGLIRLVLVVVILIVVAAFFFGYHWGGSTVAGHPDASVGTAGTTSSERTERARETGAKIGEEVADGAARANAALGETKLTAKVKSKIALDDTLKGTAVDVRTDGSTVTLSGQVSSSAQHQRVVQLARETAGVSGVVDHLAVR
jgi:hypothetical protein